jgi:hypothetical protein
VRGLQKQKATKTEWPVAETCIESINKEIVPLEKAVRTRSEENTSIREHVLCKI